MGNFSLITDTINQLRITLDHLKLQAMVIQTPSIPGIPHVELPGMNLGALAAGFDPKSVNIVELGKKIVQGVEAEGFRYLFAAIDAFPPPISSWEVWIHTLTELPVMTQAIGAFGTRMTICNCTAAEQPASLFQIPANYKVITPESLQTPALPHAPAAPSTSAAPSLPTVPSLPTAPSVGAVPSLPTTLSPPSAPSLPNAPSLPPAPSLPAGPSLPSMPAAPQAPSLPSPAGLPKF